MADLKPSTRGSSSLDRYGPVAACFAEAQGIDLGSVANPQSIAGGAATGFTANRTDAAGSPAGVQVVDWHDNPLSDERHSNNEHRIADVGVYVVPRGNTGSEDLRKVPHTSVTQKGDFITTVNVDLGTPTETATTDMASGATTYQKASPKGMTVVQANQVSPQTVGIQNRAINCRPMF